MGKSRPIGGLLAAASVVAAMLALAAPAWAATASTGGVSGLTSSSATLHGTVTSSSPAQYRFEYGTTTKYGSSTPTRTAPSGTTAVSANITGLLPGTTYHYRLLATGTYDAKPSTGADRTFTTPTAPGTVATTGQATDISATSAQLNGVANTSNDSASWFFQFGQTTAYGQSTPAHKLGRGLTLVEAAISQLQPRTTYHFRLVVLQSGSPPSYGHDAVFTTQKPFGHAVLLSRRLKVRHGFAAARFKCQGLRRAPCKGRVSLKARTGAGKHSRTVSCGAARLKMTAPRRRTLHIKLGARCGGLLANARHHRLKATLKATFSTHQSRIRARVTLIRR